MRTAPQTEQPGAANSTEFVSDREICREDSKGKFMTVVDCTDFLGHYEYLFLLPDAAKRGPGKTQAPFHKMAFRLIVHEPNPARNEQVVSRIHYMDVPDFLLLGSEVLARPYPPDPNKFKYGIEFFKAVGFSASKKEGRQLIIDHMAQARNPEKSTFKFEFQWGPAETAQDQQGFSFVGSPQKASIFMPENQLRRMMLVATDHIRSVQTAVNTRYLESLYVARK
jgi:hypothetical protein